MDPYVEYSKKPDIFPSKSPWLRSALKTALAKVVETAKQEQPMDGTLQILGQQTSDQAKKAWSFNKALFEQRVFVLITLQGILLDICNGTWESGV